MTQRIRRFTAVFWADVTKILRDRMTLVLMLAQSIIIMVLLGITFSEGIRDIPIVIVEKHHDPLSETIVKTIAGSNRFQVVAFLGSEDEAKEYINKGKAQGAVVLEDDLTKAMSTGREARVKVLVDGSKQMVQYTLRALGTELTGEIQKQIYNTMLTKMYDTFSEMNRYRFVIESANPTAEDIQALIIKHYGIYESAATGIPTAVGMKNWLTTAQTYGYSTIATLNQRMSKSGIAIASVGRAVGSVASGYEETATKLEPIAEYLIQKGTLENDQNLVQQGYTLKYIAAGLKTAYDRFNSTEIDDKLRTAGATISSIHLLTPQAYFLYLPVATFVSAPKIPREQIEETVRLLKNPLNRIPNPPASMNGSFSVTYDVMYNGDKLRVLDLIAPILIAIFVAMGTLATTAPTVVKEREKGVLERISTTPISPVEYIFSKILAALTVTTVQVVVLILVGVFAFRLYIGGGIWTLLLILLPVAVSHIGMGILISTRAKSEREAVQAIPAVMVPSIILSGIVFPVSMLPAYIRPLAYLIPLTYCQNVLMGVMVKGTSLTTFLPDLVVLFVFATVFLAGGVLAFIKTTRS